jgi:hypothetical protein
MITYNAFALKIIAVLRTCVRETRLAYAKLKCTHRALKRRMYGSGCKPERVAMHHDPRVRSRCSIRDCELHDIARHHSLIDGTYRGCSLKCHAEYGQQTGGQVE